MYSTVVNSLYLLSIVPLLVLGQSRPTESCYTSYGTKSLSTVPSTTKTVTKQVTNTVLKSSHIYVTTTPTAYITDTVTSTTTEIDTEPTQTETAYDVVLTLVTATTTLALSTETDTATVTATITTTYSGTATASTPAGFTPIMESLPNTDLRKRELEKRGGKARSRRPKLSAALLAANKLKYPAKVSCFDFVYQTTTVYSTRPQTATITKTAAASTSSETKTQLATWTSTSYPPNAYTVITSTITQTSTITDSPTTTVTNTATLTDSVVVLEASQITYAACDPNSSNNFSGGDDGHGFTYTDSVPGTSTFATDGASSASECCTQCFNLDGGCAISSYIAGAANPCRLDLGSFSQNSTTCALTSAGTEVDHGYVLSNGPQSFITSLCQGSP